MNHGSLFSGIGGFDLAAEWMGWNNVFHCEWNKFGQRVLKYYWPNAISYGDITKTDFTIHRGKIDVLSGGFPCQPFSTAGERLGTEDERHLWPEMLRSIKEIQPGWIVGENVFGIIDWNGGMVFNEVQTDLESEGYSVQSYILPACSVNAPHERKRVWFVAHSNGLRLETKCNKSRYKQNKTRASSDVFTRDAFTQWDSTKRGTGSVCRGDGLSEGLDEITFSEWRKESIKAYGNAIVPQVALQIFKAIEEYERLVKFK
jgi:DNA (cytosine-5)-methyltransferase 1